jgi:phenylacetaldehyde dehydrogenase
MTTTVATSSPREQIDLIDGAWSRPTVALPATLDDPNTGKPLQPQLSSTAEDVDRAVAAANELHRTGSWAWTPTEGRAELLNRIADGLERRVAEIAYEDAMATGNPYAVAAQMASYLAPRVRSARDQLFDVGEATDLPAGGRPVRLLRRPLGPAVVLAPWNAPTFVAVAKVASALAAGCPVILKPSEWAPGGCQIVAEVIAEAIAELDLPGAVFQFLHGAAQIGGHLVADPRVRAISFTGGAAGGRAVAQAAAPHFTALQLELGGHNPAIVLRDADVALTARALAGGMAKLNGQWCEAPGKILVHSGLHDALVDALLEELASLRLGHAFEAGTDVGPLAHRAHLQHLTQRVDDLAAAGGKALTASPTPDLGGWFFAPTVLVGLRPEESQRELFGPAVSVHAVESTGEALAAAEGPETGLAGFVFGRAIQETLQVAARIPAGEIRINGCNLADLADGSEQSFWNNAGIGAHGPTDMVRFFQGRRTVGVDDPSLPI